jgi:hypothetical protein
MCTSIKNVFKRYFLAADAKADADRKLSSAITGNDVDNPPPLPPRPGRGNRLNPNKPIIQTDAKMKPFPWTRIILRDDSKFVLLMYL